MGLKVTTNSVFKWVLDPFCKILSWALVILCLMLLILKPNINAEIPTYLALGGLFGCMGFIFLWGLETSNPKGGKRKSEKDIRFRLANLRKCLDILNNHNGLTTYETRLQMEMLIEELELILEE